MSRKVRKKSKKILTGQIKSDILNGQLERKRRGDRLNEKKFVKKIKKMLTNEKKFDILETQLAKKKLKEKNDL